MSNRFRLFHPIWAFILFTACTVPLSSPTPQPTQEVVTVEIDPAVEWIIPVANACALQTPGLSLLRAAPGEEQQADVRIFLAEQVETLDFTAEIGREEFAVIVHPSNEIMNFSGDDIRRLFAGDYRSWAEFNLAECADCKEKQDDVQVYSYPVDSDFHKMLHRIFELEKISQTALLVPDPAAARQAVALDPVGVGIIPAHFIDESVRRVSITDLPDHNLSQPVLASSEVEPVGLVRNWLLCIQESIQTPEE